MKSDRPLEAQSKRDPACSIGSDWLPVGLKGKVERKYSEILSEIPTAIFFYSDRFWAAANRL